ncbi:MAG TPA: N-acetylmuramoyl-L-alanine amidase [Pyrinomonadaceae bacterium]|nr:N-acetylmuramoyl-L-alanine amidase [Pyrinomonadaceae bacterium]
MPYELNFEAEPFGVRGRGEGPDNEGFLGNLGGFFKAASAPAAQIIDRTAFGTKTHRKGTRDINTLTALVLHQTAFSRGNAADKYDNIPVHFVVTPDGKVVQLHPLAAYLWSSNGLNPRSVAVEFVGNFRDIRGNFYKPEKFGCHALTQAQIDAGRALIKYLKTQMPKFQHVLAHRQSSDQRDNDPGPEVWYHVGQWALNNLGLRDGDRPNFTVGTGKPIPQEWRNWGQLAAARPVPASSSKRCRGGYSGELEGYEAEFEGGYEGEYEFEENKQNALDLNNPAVAKVLRGALGLAAGVKLPPTGSLGPQAGALLRTFQKQHRIKPNGVVGPRTLRALGNHIIRNISTREAEFEGEGPLGTTDCAQRCRQNFENCIRNSTFGLQCIASLQFCLRNCAPQQIPPQQIPPQQIPPQQIPPQQRPTLRRGSSGPAVADAQVRLNRWLARTPRVGLPPLVVDGQFGAKTDAMVRAFQRAHGLQADGVVGPITWGRLLNF